MRTIKDHCTVARILSFGERAYYAEINILCT